jgi:hypothetical protein
MNLADRKIMLFIAVICLALAPLLLRNTPSVAGATQYASTNCAGSQLEVALALGPGAAGVGSDVVLIANIGNRTCRITGYPLLHFDSASSAVLPVSVGHGTTMFKNVRPKDIQLQPGRSASFGIGFVLMFNSKSDTRDKCIVKTAFVALDRDTYEIPLSLDVCRSQMRVGITAIESGPYPTPFNGH